MVSQRWDAVDSRRYAERLTNISAASVTSVRIKSPAESSLLNAAACP
jgi:hypothetical protein